MCFLCHVLYMTQVLCVIYKDDSMMPSNKQRLVHFFCLSAAAPLVCVNAGCCYEMGYGAMMKPCCWQNIRDVENKEECLPVSRIGGSRVYDERSCWGDFERDQKQDEINLNTFDMTSTFWGSY